MEQHSVEVLDRKVVVAKHYPQDALDAFGSLFGNALKGDDRNLRFLDVGPQQVQGVLDGAVAVLCIKHLLEALVFRKDYNAVELVANDRYLSGTETFRDRRYRG